MLEAWCFQSICNISIKIQVKKYRKQDEAKERSRKKEKLSLICNVKGSYKSKYYLISMQLSVLQKKKKLNSIFLTVLILVTKIQITFIMTFCSFYWFHQVRLVSSISYFKLTFYAILPFISEQCWRIAVHSNCICYYEQAKILPGISRLNMLWDNLSGPSFYLNK